MTPPAPPPGFTGVRSRVLAHAQDGAHHVTLALYAFDDPGHAPVEVPYVELHETHDGARPGRVMALSALVHLCQNASDDEVWAIGGRETPGAPGVDEAASLAREAVEGWAAAARCEGACQHGHECAPSAELVAHLDALTGGAERATVGAMASPHDPPPTKDLPTLLAEIETAAQEAMRLHPHALHLAAVVALCLDARRAAGCEVGPPVAPPAT